MCCSWRTVTYEEKNAVTRPRKSKSILLFPEVSSYARKLSIVAQRSSPKRINQPSANWLTKCSKRRKRWRLARARIGTLLLCLTKMMFADIRAARCGCVPVVGRRGARSGSGSTCPGCNDHQPQNGVARSRRCPTYTRWAFLHMRINPFCLWCTFPLQRSVETSSIDRMTFIANAILRELSLSSSRLGDPEARVISFRFVRRLHPCGRKMLRITLRVASGRIAGCDACSSSDERASSRRAQGHLGSPGRPSGSTGNRRSHAVPGTPLPSSASSSSQQSQEETQFSGLAFRRGLKLAANQEERACGVLRSDDSREFSEQTRRGSPLASREIDNVSYGKGEILSYRSVIKSIYGVSQKKVHVFRHERSVLQLKMIGRLLNGLWLTNNRTLFPIAENRNDTGTFYIHTHTHTHTHTYPVYMPLCIKWERRAVLYRVWGREKKRGKKTKSGSISSRRNGGGRETRQWRGVSTLRMSLRSDVLIWRFFVAKEKKKEGDRWAGLTVKSRNLITLH